MICDEWCAGGRSIGTLVTFLTDADLAESARITADWIAFIEAGNPNEPGRTLLLTDARDASLGIPSGRPKKTGLVAIGVLTLAEQSAVIRAVSAQSASVHLLRSSR